MTGYCIIGIVKKTQKKQNFNISNSCLEEYWHNFFCNLHSFEFSFFPSFLSLFSILRVKPRALLMNCITTVPHPQPFLLVTRQSILGFKWGQNQKRWWNGILTPWAVTASSASEASEYRNLSFRLELEGESRNPRSWHSKLEVLHCCIRKNNWGPMKCLSGEGTSHQTR